MNFTHKGDNIISLCLGGDNIILLGLGGGNKFFLSNLVSGGGHCFEKKFALLAPIYIFFTFLRF